MQRIALHTRLKPGKEQQYETVHAVIPPELDAALRQAGVRSWRIWRDGLDLFHVVEVDDYRAMRDALRDHPANLPWQARMSELLDVPDDYSGNDTGLGLVWELPAAAGLPRARIGRVTVTTLGFGAAPIGNLFRAVDDDTAAAAVEAAWDAGVRYFDTAPHYGLGLSERRLGAVLRSRPRDEYVISTKVGRLLEPSPGTVDQRDDEGFDVPAGYRRRWDFSRDGVLRSLESSLRRLGTDGVDIVYLHDPDDHWEAAVSQAYPALHELRDQGVVGAIGVGMNQWQMPARFVRETDIDVVMLAGRYTLLEQPALAEFLPLCVERGVAVAAAGVFNSGLLAAPRPRPGATYNYAAAPPELAARAERLAEVCGRHGVSLPQAALGYPIRHPAVRTVVVGARTAEQIRRNAELFTTPVPDELWADLAAEGLIPG